MITCLWNESWNKDLEREVNLNNWSGFILRCEWKIRVQRVEFIFSFDLTAFYCYDYC